MIVFLQNTLFEGENYYDNLIKIIKGIAVTAVATGISLSPIASSNISHAATETTSTTQNNNAAGQISKVGENDAQFNLNKNVTYDVDENGIATLTDKTTVKLNNSLQC